MRLIATIIFLIELIFIPGPRHVVYVPELTEMDKQGIPVDYYQQECVIPVGTKVETWLTDFEWHRPYVEHEWDCSTMSTYTEWALENCGYEAEVVIIEMFPYGHAFVRVNIDGRWRGYEATNRTWIYSIGAIPNRLVFASIYSLYYFSTSNTLRFKREWAWWSK